MALTEANRNTFNFRSNKTLLIAVTVVVLVFVILYFRDWQQQHAFELHSLEKRVELLEDLSMPR